MDDDLLQDFLIEAGEILEQLNEQLVDLEQSPDDMDMLNAVFRGFHTIKGGAGFMGVDAMVQVCHRSEDLFNLLRNGERHVDAVLMDTVLPVLDVLNAQFEALRNGTEPPAADDALIQGLERIIKGEPAAAAAPAQTEAAAAASAPAESAATETPAADGEINITNEEFEGLLDALQNPDAASVPATEKTTADTASDEITDEEFDSLLDDLHGKGQFSSVSGKAAAEDKAKPDSGSETPSDEISEEEFEGLLDSLHGEGKFQIKPPVTESATADTNDAASEDITDAEFEELLDDLHGKGKIASQAAELKAEKPVIEEEPVIEEKPAAEEKAAIEEKAAEPAPTPAAKAETASTEAKAAPAPAAAKDKAAAPQAETTVRVDTKRLDDIMNMVGELVLVRNRIDRLGSSSGNEEMIKAVANLDLVTTDLQMSVMKTRMQPIKKVFGRFPRVVRDIARSLKKEIKLEMEGEDTDLDKNLVDALADPLVHLVRNAVDHGIEMPDEREKAGKPREGRVVLKAEQEGDHILLTITDDGKGMDANILRNLAVEKGLMDADAAARLDDSEVYNLIFAPGFSTKKEISDISGRGVGMDVVKTRITQLNGSVEIQSALGKGSSLYIKLPLTLAIMPTLMVQLGEQMFALPLVNVNEIFHLDLTKTNVVDGQLCVVVRGRTLPLFYLRRWLVRGQKNAELPSDGHVVVVHVGNQKVGFVVDELIGQEEVVIKPLGALLHGTAGLAGATITGDGGIALILDVPGLLQSYARSAA